MISEKKYLFEKINRLIEEKKQNLFNSIPNVHEIDDGVIVRFFTHWDNCKDDNQIKFKKIVSLDNINESIVFFYIPQGSFFDLKQRFFIGDLICLNGEIDLTFKNQTKYLNGYTKISIESDEVEGVAHENTYLITYSNKKNWSDKTMKHVKEIYGK